ncbi:DNA primase [Paenibacillus shirakamiensis]|uniref:DNA primase n=1 Tax=Paenibacillus shirakamiensis TaxID=1265935 RepID=A0ABS4JBU0_9BACL|nr:DNA primase [Paenibacillus shirakamiensis]MBP1999179.1 DNA primase [Paenibacillus shirakamiensis]
MSNGRGSIPEETIESVLRQHDIVDTVSRHVHLSKQGKYMKGLCPFHSEKTPSFTVTPEKQIFHCYGCGMGGNAIKFRMEIEGLSFPEAVRIMAEEVNIQVDESVGSHGGATRDPELDAVIQAHEWSAKLYHFLLKNTEHGKPAMEYLKARGFTDKAIDHFQIGYAPARWDTLVQFLEKRSFDLGSMEKGGLLAAKQDASGYVDRFRDRVMFPIHNRSGKVIAFGGRILGEGQPKYLNTPESKLFSKSRTLYNLHQAKTAIRKTSQVVLFEGYGDVISASEGGVHNAVATMGTALTESHAAMLKSMADQVVISFDGDNAGQAAALKSIPILETVGLQVKISVLPEGLDPDDFIQKHGGERFARQMVEGAVTSTKFKLMKLKKNHITPGSGEGAKVAYIQEALRIITPLPSPTEREIYLKELSSDMNISFDSLKQECNQIRTELQKKQSAGDNNPERWNNGRHKKGKVQTPVLLPAYHAAERRLLSFMLQDDEVARYVEKHLDDAFNIEEYAAIAAYLYAYYAQGKTPDASRFIASLHDDRLEKAVSSIAMMDVPLAWTNEELDDCIREIRKVPMKLEIEQKKEEMVSAERAGDFLRAAHIASEIIALERQ